MTITEDQLDDLVHDCADSIERLLTTQNRVNRYYLNDVLRVFLDESCDISVKR